MKQNTIWLVVFVLLSALAVVAGIFYSGPKVNYLIQFESSEPVAVTSDLVNELAGLSKDFEVILNDFLSELSADLKEYKKQRKVLNELITPFNLRNFEYIDQNYELIQVLAPDLRVRMENIMALFSKTDKQVKAALEGYPEDSISDIAAKWLSIRDNQVERYIHYLQLDDEILRVFEKLLAFYALHKNQIYYDFETDEMGFESEALLQIELKYLEEIEDLTNLRNSVL